MSTTEQKGLIIYVDEEGNHHILYPVTTVDAVDGLEEFLKAQHTAVTVTLSEAAWEGKYQTIYNIPGVTASNTVIVTPAPASHDAYGAAGVYCHDQGDGALAFTCGEAPTTDLNVNILILK